MSSQERNGGKRVRHFRQILLWPLQLAPIHEGAQIQEHWSLLEREGADNPWGEVRDEFRCAPGEFKERHYSEFVTFLPYVRRFLYGEADSRGGGSATESPIRVFRRRDIARVRVTLPGRTAPVTLDVAHVDLCFFYDIDVIVLVVEIAAADYERRDEYLAFVGRGRGSCPAGTPSSSSATRTSRFSWIARPGCWDSSVTSTSCCS